MVIADNTSDSDDNNAAMVAGIAVAVAVVLTLIVIILCCCLKKRSRVEAGMGQKKGIEITKTSQNETNNNLVTLDRTDQPAGNDVSQNYLTE